MKELIFLFLISLPIFAQQNHYVGFASTTKLTLQMPASGNRVPTIEFPDGGRAGATVSCASAGSYTVSWNGTAATSMAGTTLPLPPTQSPSAATVWSASNVGAGTAGPTLAVAAGVPKSIDLGWFKMGSSGTGNNITITTTGTCVIAFLWSERL